VKHQRPTPKINKLTHKLHITHHLKFRGRGLTSAPSPKRSKH